MHGIKDPDPWKFILEVPDYIHEWLALSSGKLSLVDTLLLPIFGREAFFHLPRSNGRGASLTESLLGYPDYLRIYSNCIGTRLGYLRMICSRMLWLYLEGCTNMFQGLQHRPEWNCLPMQETPGRCSFEVSWDPAQNLRWKQRPHKLHP